jgi:hypothetical protein
MSRVFQNIDPPSPSPPGECVLPPQQRPGKEGGGGSIFWKTRDIGLASYSNTGNLSTRSRNSDLRLRGAGADRDIYGSATLTISPGIWTLPICLAGRPT